MLYSNYKIRKEDINENYSTDFCDSWTYTRRKNGTSNSGEILISLHKEIELSSYRVLVAENSQVSLYEIGKNAKVLFGLANDSYSIQ